MGVVRVVATSWCRMGAGGRYVSKLPLIGGGLTDVDVCM